MDVVRAAILGLIQGLTEFLPISSSGHLAIAGAGEKSYGLFLIVLLHFGTLLSILVYYRRDIAAMVGGVWQITRRFAAAPTQPGRLKELVRNDAGARLALLVFVGSIPTGVIGLGLKHLAEYSATPGHLKIVGACFVVTGVLMYLCDLFPAGGKDLGRGTFRDVVTVGIFQGIAAMPGLSRSGLTVFASVMRGFERTEAARLSFLMAVPALLGANLVEMREGAGRIQALPAAVGIVTASIAGYLSLTILVYVLTSQKLRYFTGYLVTLGILVLLFSK